MTTEAIDATLKSLKKNRFDVRFAGTAAEARQVMLEMIPVSARIGVGDSATLRQIGVLDQLVRRRNEVINPFLRELTESDDPVVRRRFVETSRRTLGTDIFMAGSNAVTEDGKLVNIDLVGGRACGMVIAAPRTILAVGRNKMVRNVDEAIHRIKNVIAPAHMKHKGRKTPCAVTGECNDCDSPDRGCSVTVIMEKRPARTEFTVVLVDEDLGLGWDPAWDEKRIQSIQANYYRHCWPFWKKVGG